MNKHFLLAVLVLSSCSSPKIVRTISSSSDAPAQINCEQKVSYAKSDVTKCFIKARSTNKSFYVFHGRGTPQEIQYAQGYLLAEEVQRGSIEEMIGHFRHEEEKLGDSKWLFNALKDCQMSRLRKSASPEFLANIAALAKGYADGMLAKGLEPVYSEEYFVFTLLGIEFGNIMGGIVQEQSTSAVKAMTKVIGQCGLNIASAGASNLIKKWKKTPAHERKMGCVGMIAPDSATGGQGLIHGRNLDQSPLMKTWSRAPVVYYIHEDGRIPYVAAGTAGLIYPGGISGFNQHGLAVSLHQMNTTRWDSKHKEGSAEVVPNLQQRILREARTIDEAFALVKKTNVYSSWSIFISDSKTNEAASIEISPDLKVIARRTKNQIMGQSNHFIHPRMQKEHFHSNFAAYIETQSRLHQMEKTLREGSGRIDVPWAMDTLSTHQDYFEGERSFGRVFVKLSNIMTSIAHPAKGEFWMTVGDKRPAAHSWYVGTKVNFEADQLEIIGANKSFKHEDKQKLEQSYSKVVDSYMAYRAGDNKQSIELLEEALKLSAREDTAYIYSLARLHMMEGEFEKSKGYLDRLLNRLPEFHPYQQALILMYSARLRQKTGTHSAAEVNELFDRAAAVFAQILKDSGKNKLILEPQAKTMVFEEARFNHGSPDLKKKLKLISSWKADKNIKIPALDFAVTD